MSSRLSFVCSLAALAAGTVATSELLAAEKVADRQQPAAKSSAKVRESTELSDAAKRALRTSHAAKSAKERDAAARELVQVFVELQADRSLANSVRHQLQQQVRHRLLAIKTGLRSAINSVDSRRKNSDLEKASGDVKDGPNPHAPPTVALQNRSTILAQQVAPPAAPGAAPAPRVNNQPNGQPPDDYGPELLALIQRVIRPASWDVNGGASSGYYFQPLHALVISAPEEMHGEIGGVVGGLRK